MTSAIILAAGKGQRMGTELPKQFLSMGDGMLLTKTLRVFEESRVIQDIVLVTSEEWVGFCKKEIVEREGSIDASNVMLVDPKTGKPTRVGYRINEDGSKSRIAKRSGEVIDTVSKAKKGE